MEKYTGLLRGVAMNIEDEPVSNPAVVLEGYNQKTGTYDKALVSTYDPETGSMRPAYRIVQPGNTLSQIAQEMKGDLQHNPPLTTKQYQDFLQHLNHIKDPNKILDGKAIKLRSDV